MGGAPAPSAAVGASGAAGVASVETLMALQGAGPDADASGRAAARATDILDVLDGLKLALLEGGAITSRLSQLAALASRERAGTDDARLESLLDEVEVRAAVELAKHAAV